MQTIVLTGADGGIGSAIKTVLEHVGVHVISITRKDADLSKAEEVAELGKKILTEYPSIDWLICAHGFIDDAMPITEQLPENIEMTFAVNTLSLGLLAHSFLPYVPVRGGMIVLTSSAGLAPNGRYATYSASKAAANALIQALARDDSDHAYFAIAPGPTNTAMRERLASDAAKMQSPSVVAELVGSLVKNNSSYVSGDIILVKDGTVSIASRLS